MVAPIVVAENHHGRSILDFIVALDGATQSGSIAESVERAARCEEAMRPIRIADAVHRRRVGAVGTDAIEGALTRRHLEVVRDRDELLRDAGPRITMIDDHQPVRGGIWQRPQQHCLDDGEDGGVAADAESKREHGGERERRFAKESAECVPEVVRHSIQILAWTFRVGLHVVYPRAADEEWKEGPSDLARAPEVRSR